MKNVLYYFLDHKKINGTLFYCFEYYIFARERSEAVIFNICNISDEDLKMVKNLFREKYVFNYDFLEDVKSLNSITEIYQAKNSKTLIMDIHSLNKTYMFIRNDILCFSNEAHPMVRSQHKKISYYGFYDYQNFDYKTMLKLNFSIFKPVQGPVGDKVFVTSRLFNYREITLPLDLSHKKIITKVENNYHSNLFELFDTLFYYHSDFDTNNRLIPECFYYKKKIVLKLNPNFQDSIALRYEDIKQNGLKNYNLEENDHMMRNFLS